MASGCLDEGRVLAFVDGTISGDSRDEIESHIAVCATCSDLTVWAAAEQALSSRVPGDEGRPFIGALAAGTRVDRYQILSAVGRGGMGEVYAAYHPDLDRRIALKVVGDTGGAPERRARLLREARAIARLSHPNVITVHDAGTVDDRVYLAMEFVEGQTVDQWLRAGARSWREILDVFVGAARGLAAAHAAGVVHRDFKPQNVMIGRDGSVRVMDFGLARLAEEPPDPPEIESAVDARPAVPATVTKTGTLIGTPAYMSPEQFRRERLDARTDQFSFCVALHEALYGSRPRLPHLVGATPAGVAAADASGPSRRSGAPAWLRHLVVRGLSENRERRFTSMDALLAAVSRGQTRVRTRAAVLAAGAAVVLLSVGGWRLAAARRVSCAAPAGRLAAVWMPGDESNPRRQAVHRALAASGRPTAETVWQRVARALDEYGTQWSAMHVEACEATHVRGDQSSEVLDLRMGCLTETLDGLRALTDVLSRADGAMAAQPVTAAQNLMPLGRCADIPALRSTVPPPRDAESARVVAALRGALREAKALEEVGNVHAAMEKAAQILPRAEAAGYKPLLAEVLLVVGAAKVEFAPREAAAHLEGALYAAEASRDDLNAAKAASFLVGAAYEQDQFEQSERWAHLAHAILDRFPSPQNRVRSWVLQNQAGALMRQRKAETALRMQQQALALKEAALGRDHPDVARTAGSLAWILTELGRPTDALPLGTRAIEILSKLDPDNSHLGYALTNRGEALNALGRYAEAEADHLAALRILQAQFGASNYLTSHPLHGLGVARLGSGDPDAAVRYLNQALGVRDGAASDPINVADTEFALAQALVASGGDRRRARALATEAQAIYAKQGLDKKQGDVVAWLAAGPRGGERATRAER